MVSPEHAFVWLTCDSQSASRSGSTQLPRLPHHSLQHPQQVKPLTRQHPHQVKPLTSTHLEGVGGQDALPLVQRQELGLGIVAGEAAGHLHAYWEGGGACEQ